MAAHDSGAAPNRHIRLAALTGMTCPAVFFAVMMVLGPRYDWAARFGSVLALGRH
jgi:hypothetical protein